MSSKHKIHTNLGANTSINSIDVISDMSKALDKIWHNCLLGELQPYAIQLWLLVLLEDYLSNRKHRDMLNGVMFLNGNTVVRDHTDKGRVQSVATELQKVIHDKCISSQLCLEVRRSILLS